MTSASKLSGPAPRRIFRLVSVKTNRTQLLKLCFGFSSVQSRSHGAKNTSLCHIPASVWHHRRMTELPELHKDGARWVLWELLISWSFSVYSLVMRPAEFSAAVFLPRAFPEILKHLSEIRIFLQTKTGHELQSHNWLYVCSEHFVKNAKMSLFCEEVKMRCLLTLLSM